MSVLTEMFEFWITARITAGEAPLCLSALPSCLLGFSLDLSLSLSPFICVSTFLPLLFPLLSIFSLCLLPSLLFFPNTLPLALPHLSPLFLIVCSSPSLPLALRLHVCWHFFFFYLALSVCLKMQDINKKIRAEHVNIGNFFLDGPLSWSAFPSESGELTNSLRISQSVRDLDVKKHLTIKDSKPWAISGAHPQHGGTSLSVSAFLWKDQSEERGEKEQGQGQATHPPLPAQLSSHLALITVLCVRGTPTGLEPSSHPEDT